MYKHKIKPNIQQIKSCIILFFYIFVFGFIVFVNLVFFQLSFCHEYIIRC